MCDLDVVRMIKLISTKPRIWDKSLTKYHSRTRREADEAWGEVFQQLVPGYNEMTDEYKETFGKMVVSKWRNIRDQWLKDCKKAERKRITGAAAKHIRKYIYHDEMAFLKKNMASNITDETVKHEMEDAKSEESNFTDIVQPEAVYSQSRNTQMNMSRLDTASTNSIKCKPNIQTPENPVIKETDDHKLCFFKSLLHSIQDFSCDEFLELQTQILCFIQDIRRRSTNQTDS